MDWIVVSSFVIGNSWIPSFARSGRHRFHVSDPAYRHDPWRRETGLNEWRDFFRQGIVVWMQARRCQRAGVVTVLPPLAVVLGCIKRLTRSKRPVVAWMFNLSRIYEGKKGTIARFALASVDIFVVHSVHEIEVYSAWLNLPRDRFIFVPLSVVEIASTVAEDDENPFILAMGQANRDYALLINVLKQTGYRGVIVAPSRLLDHLELPSHVEVRSGLSIAECHVLCERARISVVPLTDISTASGQVTVLDAMMLGRPVVATRSVGTRDYIEDAVNGILVDAGDVDGMQRALESIWTNDELRQDIARSARRTAVERFTFSAVAERLEEILDDAAKNYLKLD